MDDWLGSLPDASESCSSWLNSLPVDIASDVGTAVVEKANADEDEESENELESLVSMGFEREMAKTVLAETSDYDEALAKLSELQSAAGAKRRRLVVSGNTVNSLETEGELKAAGEPVEIEGIQCAVSDSGELMLRLPNDPLSLAPVVGKRTSDGAISFDGMDEWLWELYESHPPRETELPSSFDPIATLECLEKGAPYVWNVFANEEEVKAAHAELDGMFSRREMARGSGAWVDECADGGHAHNRKALEGHRRDDACGFWDLQGNEPAPPPTILAMFRRLEAAGAKLRAAHGWPVLCSRLGMGAVYNGGGAQYSQHRDNEWQRMLKSKAPKAAQVEKKTSDEKCSGAWMNFRELTMVAYFNLPDSFADDETGKQAGGRLRCYVDTKKGDLVGSTATELQDVAPIGGRAVIFRSRELLHEVLPTFGRRYALTLWFCTAV